MKTELCKKSQVDAYFKNLLPELKGQKIKAVFSLDPVTWGCHEGYRMYHADAEIYILFENDKCLVLDYPYIDTLTVDYRVLSAKERKVYKKALIKDCFNSVDDIYGSSRILPIRTETISLEYGELEKIELRSVTWEYEKWIDQEIKYVVPTEETFDMIDFVMKNGRIFCICPGEASDDGYTMLWSEDSRQTTSITPVR